MNILLIILLSIFFLITVERVKRQKNFTPQNTRRFAHIGATVIAACSAFIVPKNIIVISCIGFALAMLYSHKKKLLSSVHDVNRKTYGEIFLPLGEAITALLFLPHSIPAFQFGVLVLGFSDASASFIGEKYGHHPFTLFNNKKSIEGSAAFFIVTLLITLFFLPTVGLHLLFIPLLLTLVEAMLSFGLDNLIIPVFGSLLFSYFM